MRSTDRLSEQETLDIQRAIAASLDPNMSSTSGNAVASTSASTLDAPPVRPVKQEQVPVQKRQAKELGSERDFNPLKLKQDALPWSMIEKNGPQMVLTDALYLYALGSGPPSLDEPPKVVRWDQGLKLYKNGALRMTRTQGRRDNEQPNCISLEDLIKPESMLGMYSNTFLLEWDFIAPLLPILSHPHAKRLVPILLGQPIFYDPYLWLACRQAGIEPSNGTRLTAAQCELVAPMLTRIYQEVLGRNVFTIHPKCQGCSHTKLFVIRYPGYLMVVITSANTMVLDMELCDNLWYIQTFPEISLDQDDKRSSEKRQPSEFQKILQQHMNELECPEAFLSFLDDYDFSTASDIKLVVSQPGVVSPSEFSYRSIGRMASVAREMISGKERDQIKFEVCCASLGALKGEWMESLDWLLRGKDASKLKIGSGNEEGKEERGKGKGKGKELEKSRKRKRSSDESDDKEGDWKIIYSPRSYVKGCSDEVQSTAVNMSSYWKGSNWVDVPPETRKLFYTYHSKEPGRLFHQKTILWLSSTAPRSTPPHLLYLGSHNFSSAAWGTPAFYSSKSKKMGIKTDGVNNYEMGVMIKGERIEGMLEKGSKWHDIVTWERPVERFAEDDVPWVSESWVKKLKESSELTDGSNALSSADRLRTATRAIFKPGSKKTVLLIRGLSDDTSASLRVVLSYLLYASLTRTTHSKMALYSAGKAYGQAIKELGKQYLAFHNEYLPKLKIEEQTVVSAHTEWISYLYKALFATRAETITSQTTNVLQVRTNTLHSWSGYLYTRDWTKLPVWYDAAALGNLGPILYQRFDFYQHVLWDLEARWKRGRAVDAVVPDWISNERTSRCWRIQEGEWQSSHVSFETRRSVLMALESPRDEEPRREIEALVRELLEVGRASVATAQRSTSSRSRTHTHRGPAGEEQSLSHRGPMGYRQALLYQQ